MMGHRKISPPRFEAERRQGGTQPQHRRRFLLIAVVLSLGVHLAAALLVALLPRILPKDAQPQEEGTVELLMVEQKGAEPTQPRQPKDNQPAPAPAERNDAPKGQNGHDEAATPLSKANPAPPASESGGEPTPPTAQAEPKATDTNNLPPEKEADVHLARPRSQEAPVFDLAGTDSESNAIVLGGRVLPAMKDDRFRNRPPVYPAEAVIHGEHGAVTVVIHVSENGAATGADVQESSGYEVLDQAAVTAVRKWHFHPAMREGRAVPFDMPFRFIFE